MLPHQLRGFQTLRLERANPVAECHGVMLTQTLDVSSLEARTFRCRDHIIRRGKLTVGKYVGIDERISSPELPKDLLAQRSRSRLAQAHDAVIQEESPWLERTEHRGKVHRQVSQSDVLDHSDTRDLVEGIP